MTRLQFGSVCSGIEAASVAWAPLGWEAAWFSEIEPFPSAVLAHHYPTVSNLGDMTKISRMVLTGEVVAPDVLCGGTPCQAFSVAGLRESLSDDRGNLTLKFVEIADAIDHVRGRAGLKPSTIFWENVPGVLSTKDNAFGCFLAGLAGEDEPLLAPGNKWANAGCVYGPARAVAWRTLDAQYFGVAQRRRRVFVVASARNGFDPAAVLFEWDGLRRDTAPSREEGKNAAGSLTASAGRRGGVNDPERGQLIEAFGGNNQSGPIDVATARNACASASGRMDFETETFLVQPTHTLRGEGFDASEDGTGRGTPLVPVAVDDVRYAYYSHDYANDRITDVTGINPALTARNTASGNLNVAVPVAFPANLSGTQHASAENLAPAMGAKNQTAVAHVQIMPTMTAGGPSESSHNQVSGQMRDAYMVPTTAMQVRRLTPVECERLQGFPDGYTQIPWRKKPASECPDGPRYKALGNSWAVPVVTWIGRRIARAIGGAV